MTRAAFVLVAVLIAGCAESTDIAALKAFVRDSEKGLPRRVEPLPEFRPERERVKYTGASLPDPFNPRGAQPPLRPALASGTPAAAAKSETAPVAPARKSASPPPPESGWDPSDLSGPAAAFLIGAVLLFGTLAGILWRRRRAAQK